MKINEETKKWASETLVKIDEKMRNSIKHCDIIPYTTENGRYAGHEESTWWTNGFFGGLMWLLYNDTKFEGYRETAEKNEKILSDAFGHFDELHHDVGFMFHLTCGANYQITKNKASRNANLIAASMLAARYNIEGGYIRAWGNKPGNAFGEVSDGFTIIDTMMNIPLLFWASRETGDRRFAAIAEKHAEMAMRDHIRPDGSVVHIVMHDTKTGEVIKTVGGQGYGEGSAWSRGASWAVYGFALAYIHTGREEFLDAAKRCAHYFVFSILDDDFVPRADFRAPEEPVYIDTTAGAITACGLIEIARNVSEFESGAYLSAAIKMLKGLEKHCDFDPNHDSCLQDGRECYNSPKNQHIIYGDFYLVDALSKLKGNDILLW